jgi:SM-20-related protein
MTTNMFLQCSDLAAECAKVFAANGRIHIPDALDDASAAALHTAMRDTEEWALVVNSGDEVYDIKPDDRAAGGPEVERRLAELAASGGRGAFQFIFESIRLSEAGEPFDGEPALLGDLTRFLNSDAFIGFARRVTSDPSIAFCDAQATRYRPGHFLTAHDDKVEAKKRRAAFVLNLTPSWKADWGGLLNFIDEDGHVAEGYTPAWNALNLFRVPQLHHVSYVNPLAGADRLSITGWLRAR